MEKVLHLYRFGYLYGITGPGQMQYLRGEDVFCKPPVAQRVNPQQTPLMQKEPWHSLVKIVGIVTYFTLQVNREQNNI